MTTSQYKGSSKFIIQNNNIILEQNSTWYRFPFYSEKTESDVCDFDVIIESNDDIDYHVKMYIIIDDDSDYNDCLKIPLDTLKDLDLDDHQYVYIDGKLLSISALAILKEYIRLYVNN